MLVLGRPIELEVFGDRNEAVSTEGNGKGDILLNSSVEEQSTRGLRDQVLHGPLFKNLCLYEIARLGAPKRGKS